jgi:hypothetical protein
MKVAALILGCISGVSVVIDLVLFDIWTQHFQLGESTPWDVLFWIALVAAPVGIVAGCLAIALVLGWLWRRAWGRAAS